MEYTLKIAFQHTGSPDMHQRCDGEFTISLQSLAEMAGSRSPAVQGSFADFLRFWEEEWKHLLCPAAFLAPVQKGMPAHHDAVCALWTIGDKLEKKVSQLFSEGAYMKGTFLDAAGTCTLLHMHRAVFNQVRAYGYYVIDERYPDETFPGDFGTCEIITVTGAHSLISAAGNQGMFIPKKTVCSYFILGKDKEKALRREKQQACSRCPGKQCLCYQIGSCHLRQ